MTRLDTAGSTLFKLTWKGRRTPLGRRYLEHVVSVPRKSEADCTSWPRPQVHDDKKRGNTEAECHYFPHDLSNAAELAAWPRPMAGSPGTETYNEAGNTDSSRKTVALASWSRPNGDDANNGTRESGVYKSLTREAQLTGWARPRSEDSECGYGNGERELQMGGKNCRLEDQAQLTVSGETPNGSTAPTESIGQLNPEHSRWLMGIPTVWGCCAAMVTRSVRRKPRSSSKQ